MGFFDSLKGFGRATAGAFGSLVSGAFQVAAPLLAQAGAQALGRSLGIRPSGRTPFVITPAAPFAPRPVLPGRQVVRQLPALPGPLGVTPAVTGRRQVGAAPGFGGVTLAGGTSGFGLLSELAERAGGLFGGQTTFFTAGQVTARAVRDITQVNPVTGKIEFWRHMGRPVLFTGDLATVRRVSRVASRLNRRLGRRRPR